jgi:tetratricopeptide (TPR) repeat protein
MRCLVSAVLVGAVLSGDAHAQQSVEDPEQQALDLFLEAEQAYQRGEIARAVELLQRAWSMHEEPTLLFNLARAYETLGQIDDALATYRHFLEVAPATDDRGAIETRIRALEQQIAERERLERERAEAEQRSNATPAREPESLSAWPFVIGGAGLATAGTALAFVLLANDARDDAEAEERQIESLEIFAQGEDYMTLANVFWIATGALGVAAVTWFIVDVLTLDPGTASAAGDRLRFTF